MPYKDPQEKAANDRAYYIANKERIRARSAEYRKSHLAEERKSALAGRRNGVSRAEKRERSTAPILPTAAGHGIRITHSLRGWRLYRQSRSKRGLGV